jgi:ABC-type microcin C transport system permease subunit YejB
MLTILLIILVILLLAGGGFVAAVAAVAACRTENARSTSGGARRDRPTSGFATSAPERRGNAGRAPSAVNPRAP